MRQYHRIATVVILLGTCWVGLPTTGSAQLWSSFSVTGEYELVAVGLVGSEFVTDTDSDGFSVVHDNMAVADAIDDDVSAGSFSASASLVYALDATRSFGFISGNFTYRSGDLHGYGTAEGRVTFSGVAATPFTGRYIIADNYAPPVELPISLFAGQTWSGAMDAQAQGAGNTSDKDGFSLTWAVNGASLPGETPDNPLPSGPTINSIFGTPDDIHGQHDQDDGDDGPTGGRGSEIGLEPGRINGVNLTTTTVVPVVEDGYGHSDTVYIDPVLALGYGFYMEGDNRFKTFEVPDALPQGDDAFFIAYNDIGYSLAAGETFDFTTIDPLGVDSFLLLGIDETELIDGEGEAHPPFVYGATFMTPGIAEVTTFPLVYVPTPGDSNGDGKVDGIDYLVWAENFGDDPADDPPGSPENGDFNEDGVVNGIDYLTWASNFGQGRNDAVAVPEPGTCVLLIMGVAMLPSRRWRCGGNTYRQ